VGHYANIKRITNPRADTYERLYHIFEENEISYDQGSNAYHIDETGDGQFDYSIINPNFNFKEFRSNLVIRWEYKLGSTLYFVWTHGRSHWESVQSSSLAEGLSGLYDSPPDNLFLIKFNYWFSL
jgi:hypothetical protein